MRRYSTAFKNKVIETAATKGVSAASREFKVAPQSIVNWNKKRASFNTTMNKAAPNAEQNVTRALIASLRDENHRLKIIVANQVLRSQSL